MTLEEKIRTRKALVVVVGGGYVGLPLAVACAEARFDVKVVDTDPARVAAINRGESYIADVPSERLIEHIRADRLIAHGPSGLAADADVLIICVPTPLNKTKDPDNSHILAVANEIAMYTPQTGRLVILESTTFPGFTREVLAPKFNGCYVAFSPERIDPGNQKWGIKNTPKVVGGVTPEATKMAVAFYETFVNEVVTVSNADTAELAKLLENTYRTVNIGLANELAIMCHHLGVDTREVIEAAATKPYGFTPFYPGPGTGGHCIPVDPLYLAWRLKTMRYDARFIATADEVNSEMPAFVVERVTDALNHDRKSVKGSRVLVVGIAYKKDVADTRESPALDIIERLRNKGAKIWYLDPLVKTSAYYRIIESDLDEGLSFSTGIDCIVIATDHTAINWDKILALPCPIIDTRGVTFARETRGRVTRL